jgi:hypothetical protein
MQATLSQDIQTLREAITALPAPAPGSRRTYPAAIRTQAARLLEQGVALKFLSRGTGLRVDLLKRWGRAARVKESANVRPAPRVFAIEQPTHAAPVSTMLHAPMTPPPPPPPPPEPLRLQLGAFVVTVTLAEVQL